MQELCAQLAHMTNECEVYELDLSQLIPVTMSLSFGVLGKLHTHHRAFFLKILILMNYVRKAQFWHKHQQKRGDSA